MMAWVARFWYALDWRFGRSAAVVLCTLYCAVVERMLAGLSVAEACSCGAASLLQTEGIVTIEAYIDGGTSKLRHSQQTQPFPSLAFVRGHRINPLLADCRRRLWSTLVISESLGRAGSCSLWSVQACGQPFVPLGNYLPRHPAICQIVCCLRWEDFQEVK